MIVKNKKSQKLISSLILISIIVPSFLFLVPKNAKAFWGVFDTNVADAPSLGLQGETAVSAAAIAGSSAAGTGSTITNTSYTIKSWAKLLLEQALMAVARRALQEITKSTINWINGGFHGSPLFLENPQSFFGDIAKYEVRNIVDQFGYNSRLYPFGKAFVLNTINSYKSTLANNAATSLSNVMNEQQIRNYYTLNGGGWNGFFIKTQYPQNNYLGFQMLASQELALKLQGTTQNAAQKIQTTLQQGQGFLSPQSCPTNPRYNNGTNEFQKPSFDVSAFNKEWTASHTCPQPQDSDNVTPAEQAALDKCEADYQSALMDKKTSWMKDNFCPGGLVNTTPGTVVANQITNAMGSQFRQTELAGALGNSLSAIFDALLNKFIGDGLNSLASKANPTPPADTWTYNGISLGSPQTGTGQAWDSGPEEEIVLDKFKKQLKGKTIVVATDAEGTTTTKEETGNTCLNGTCADSLGTCSGIKDSAGKALPDRKNVTRAQCDAVKGIWTITSGKEYIPGDIYNTQLEIALMDNPCNPADTACLVGLSDPNGIDSDYIKKYSPGVAQLIKPITKQTQTLDQCVPGPDKGWENRLIEEQDLASSRLSFDVASKDQMKQRQSALVLKDLKFAVDSFKNWITTKMMSSLPSAIIYMDALKNINEFPQQMKESSDARRTKSQALMRLFAIEKALDVFTEQPSAGSPQEKQLITIRQQYNAVRTSISSTSSIEDTRNQLNTLKDQLTNLKDLNIKCATERKAAGWEDIDKTGKGDSKLNGVSEKDKFCSIPIQAGYSHGDLLRGYDWHGDPAGADATASGFSFRNPRNSKGDAGYEDLPLVNAHWVYGDVTCTGICAWPDPFSGLTGFRLSDVFKTADDMRTDVSLSCDIIFKANQTDYTHAGDLSF